MRAQLPGNHTCVPTLTPDAQKISAAQSPILKPLWELAGKSEFLLGSSIGQFAARGAQFHIPRFIFMGPKGGGDTIRLAIFAAFDGEELNGSRAVAEFLTGLEASPDVARGFHIFAYPVCNPSGIFFGTRHNFTDADLTREFWRKSSQPEIYYLEREMGVHNFHGVISLHVSRNRGSFFATSRSVVLQSSLATAAVEAANGFSLPWDAGLAMNRDIPSNFLTLTDELGRIPFEINFGIPGLASEAVQVQGAAAALKAIVESYRGLMALRANI